MSNAINRPKEKLMTQITLAELKSRLASAVPPALLEALPGAEVVEGLANPAG